MTRPLGKFFARGVKSPVEPSGYPKNWRQISAAFRDSRKHTCEVCGVDCREHTSLTDAHHKNGDKSDCDYKNLMCLCVSCHSKQPAHGHYEASGRKMEKLRQLWEAQNIPAHLREK